MNDAFYELLVPQKAKAKDIASVILICAAIIILTFIGFSFLGFYAALIGAAGIGTVTYFLFPRLKKEHEYYLLNYTLEVSLIENKANRKSLLEFDIRKADIVAPVGSDRLSGYRPTKTLDFSSGTKNNQVYSIIIPMDHNLCNILIEPDDTMKDQMKLWLGQKMYL